MKPFLNFFLVLTAVMTIHQAYCQQNINGSFYYNGYLRSYIIHVPPGYSSATPVPLVLNLHGYGSNASQQQAYSMFDNVADTAKVIVVYPNAVNSVWDTLFGSSPINDVGFISVLIDTIESNYSIDSEHIYSTGLSMGGFMTYRLACELSSRIAAVASVAGPTVQQIFTDCNSTPSIPVLHIHGTADPTVPYGGIGIWPPVDTIIQYFVNKNNCPAVADSFSFPDTYPLDSCTVTRYSYLLCDDSSEVLFYKVFDGGHTWPSGLINIPQFGRTNRDINANIEIWNFFRKHKLITLTSAKTVQEQIHVISVFPVPANSKIDVRCSDRIDRIAIMTPGGQKLTEINIPEKKEIMLDVKGMQPGFYILEVVLDFVPHIAGLRPTKSEEKIFYRKLFITGN